MEALAKSPDDVIKFARTRVGNGSAWLVGVDGRCLFARRLKEIFGGYLSERPDAPIAMRAILRRVAVIEGELERLERDFALKGGATDAQLDLYSRTAGNHRRLLECVGLEPRPRDVTPSVGAYVDHIKQQSNKQDDDACE